MPRRKSASLQARHQPKCKLGKPWTTFENATKAKGCSCKPGPVFYVVSRPETKQVREEVGRNRENASRALLRVRGDLDDQTYEPPRNMLVPEAIDEWEASWQRPKETTRRVYKGTGKLMRKTWPTRTVRHIGTADLTALLAACGDVTDTTKRRHLRVAHSFFEWARKRRPQLIAHNPVAELPEQQRPQADDRKGSPFERAELERLWEHLDEPYKTMAKLSAATGLRQGELVALRWLDLEKDLKVIHVRRSYAQGLGQEGLGFAGGPKSKTSKREVIVGEKVIALLEQWRRTSGHLPTPAALIFPGPGRDGQIVDSTLRRALYEAMADAKIEREWKPDPEYRPRDWHSLRHSFARAAIGQGIGLEWIAEQLGHSSISVTERNYKHFQTDARHELAAGLDNALSV
jgi:integrase